MGKLIERLAVENGHEIGVIIDDSDANLFPGELAEKLRGCDVAIDFTVAMAVRRNVEACVKARVPVVLGTTGWNEQRQEVELSLGRHEAALEHLGAEHRRRTLRLKLNLLEPLDLVLVEHEQAQIGQTRQRRDIADRVRRQDKRRQPRQL